LRPVGDPKRRTDERWCKEAPAEGPSGDTAGCLCLAAPRGWRRPDRWRLQGREAGDGRPQTM